MTSLASDDVQLGDYHLKSRLSVGGSAIVYRGRQDGDENEVAVKVLGTALTRPQELAKLRLRAGIIADLRHPAIARVRYVGQDEQLCYVVSDLVEGPTLRDLISGLTATQDADARMDYLVQEYLADSPTATSQRFDLPADDMDFVWYEDEDDGVAMTSAAKEVVASADHLRRSCEIVRDAARGLDYAHAAGVIHGDVKPENLLLDGQGDVRIIDFDIAGYLNPAKSTVASCWIGTIAYMSPEQLSGEFPVDARSDVYSLGAVLYELLSLRQPVEAGSSKGMLARMAAQQPLPLRWANPAISSDLEAVVHKAIASDPEERYADAADFAADLDRYLKRERIQARPHRHRFDESQIKASRPTSVVLAAFSMLMIAAVYAPYEFANLTRALLRLGPSASILLSFVILIAVVIGAGWWSRAFLNARKWPRWPTVALSLCTIGYAIWKLCWRLWLMSNLETHLPVAERLLSVLGPIAAHILVTCLSVVIVWNLLRRKTADWFSFSEKARFDFRTRRQAFLTESHGAAHSGTSHAS